MPFFRIQKEAEVAVAASRAEMEQEMQHQMENLISNMKEAEIQLVCCPFAFSPSPNLLPSNHTIVQCDYNFDVEYNIHLKRMTMMEYCNTKDFSYICVQE